MTNHPPGGLGRSPNSGRPPKPASNPSVIEVDLGDGTIAEFPADTPRERIEQAAKDYWTNKSGAQKPSQPSSPLAEFRSKYPQYNDLSDRQLADALHAKHYSDIPKDEFDRRIGLPPAKPATDPARIPKRRTALHRFMGGALDTITFGFNDEIAAGIQAITGVNGKKGDYQANLARERAEAEQGGAARLTGQIAGGFIPVLGAAGKGVNTVRSAAKVGAAYGAMYGLGSGDGGLEERAESAALGAATGAAGGAMLAKAPALAKYAAKNATPTRRFVNRQLANNPHAAFDAEVAADITRLADDLPPMRSSARKAVLAEKVAALEGRYLPTRQSIDALDLPPSEKARLKKALTDRHSLTADDLQALRGSTAGDAVADGILKVQRLRALVPHGRPTPSLVRRLGSLAADAASVGPLAKYGARVAGGMMDVSANPGSKGLKAVAKARGKYAALAERTGPSGATESASRLVSDAGEALDARYLAKRSAALRKAQEATDSAKLTAENRKVGMLNARDNVRPTGGFRGYLYDRTGLLPAEQDTGLLKLVAEGKVTPEQQRLFLEAPEKLQRGNAGNAILDRLKAMADAGTLKRDAAWSPTVAEGAVPAAPGIRNPLAYQATARASQERVSQTLALVQQEARFGSKATADIASAVTRIGATSDRVVADRILKSVMRKLPDTEARAYARTILEPLTKAIKPQAN